MDPKMRGQMLYGPFDNGAKLSKPKAAPAPAQGKSYRPDKSSGLHKAAAFAHGQKKESRGRSRDWRGSSPGMAQRYADKAKAAGGAMKNFMAGTRRAPRRDS
jgi:hypothetical protein